MLELEDEGMDKIYRKLYQPAIRTFFDMEEAGVSVDVKEIERMRVEMTKDLDALSYRLFELSGCVFNPNSSQQLTMLLFGIKPDKESKSKSKKQKEEYDSLSKILMDNNFGFKPIGFTKKGAISTDNDTIYTLANKDYKDKHRSRGVELCKVLLDYKKLYKLKTAFVDGLLEQMYDDGKVHPTFNINGASSGRLSCQNPNLQQLPKAHEEDKYQIRSVFRGSEMPDGRRKKIIALDFSNLEMRVLAHWSLDKNLLTMFANGDDVHGSTAVNMFELKCTPAEVKKLYADLRQAAKIINFMLSYGGGARALYEALKNDHYSPIDLGDKVLEFRQKYPHRTVRNGIDVAQIYIDTYFAKYSGVADFIKSQKRFAHHNRYVLTLLGRKRRLPDINSEDGETRSYCERLSVNGCIQGSASDITESAQNRIAKDPWFYEHNCIMLIQVHDELVFECPEEYVEEAIPKIKWYMEHPFGDKVKLNLDFIAESGSGDNYQQAK
jgi:DNA polymerase-1